MGSSSPVAFSGPSGADDAAAPHDGSKLVDPKKDTKVVREQARTVFEINCHSHGQAGGSSIRCEGHRPSWVARPLGVKRLVKF